MAITERERQDQTRHQNGDRRVVQHGRASTTSSIAHAIVIKHDALFFLCDPNGEVPMDESHGLGLYYHDCRYLNGYELRLGDTPADRLAATAGAGFWTTFELTNPDLKSPDGHLVEKERVGITWERTLDADACALRETIAFSNFSVDRVEVPVTIRLRSDFDSLFQVRGAQPKQRGTIQQPRWRGATLEFVYDGADHVRRALHVSFDPAPRECDGTTAAFHVSIEPR